MACSPFSPACAAFLSHSTCNLLFEEARITHCRGQDDELCSSEFKSSTGVPPPSPPFCSGFSTAIDRKDDGVVGGEGTDTGGADGARESSVGVVGIIGGGS